MTGYGDPRTGVRTGRMANLADGENDDASDGEGPDVKALFYLGPTSAKNILQNPPVDSGGTELR